MSNKFKMEKECLESIDVEYVKDLKVEDLYRMMKTIMLSYKRLENPDPIEF